MPDEMTTQYRHRWGLCAVAALALAACSAESESSSTNPLTAAESDASDVAASSVAPVPAVTTDEDEPRAGTAAPATIVGDLGPASSGPTSVDGSTAEHCPAGEYPSFGAFDLASGALQWSACSPEEAYRAVIGASDDIALVLESSDNGSAVVIALDVGDGTERWRLSAVRGLGLPPGPIGGQGTAVLETDFEGAPFVVGVDIITGVERWRIEPGESVIGQTDNIVVVSGTPGTLASGPGGPPGGLRGIDRATGAERWVNDDVVFDDRSGVGVGRGAAAVAGTTIAVPTGSTLTAVDMATGVVLWIAPQLDHPVAADGVFVGSEPAKAPPFMLRAVDATTGTTLWSAAGQPSYGDLLAMGDGVIVVGIGETGAELVAYDLVTGDERWRVPHTSGEQPQFVMGTSIVMLWEEMLEVRSTTDGSRTWAATQPLRSPLMSSAGSNATTVFVAVNSLPWGD